jgi:hypothetical protein
MKKMIRKAGLVGAIASMTLAFGTASADGVNISQFANAGQAVALNRGMASVNRNKITDTDITNQCNGAELNIGNFNTPEGLRAPRQVTIIIKGDVTNVNKGTGAACR